MQDEIALATVNKPFINQNPFDQNLFSYPFCHDDLHLWKCLTISIM